MGDGEPTSRGWRTAFAITLLAAMGIGPFSVLAVSALAPFLVPELGLSRTQLGTVATVTFATAAVASSRAGSRVDRYPGRTILIGVFAGGGVAAATMGTARSLQWLWAGAVIAGTVLAVANLVTNQLIAAHVPAGRQGVQIGVKQSGTSLSLAVVGFGLPPLATLIGWQRAVLIGTGLAAAGLIATRLIVPETAAMRSPTPTASSAPLSGQSMWLLGGYAWSAGVLSQAVVVYLPLYAFEILATPAALAGMTTGLLGGLGAVGRVVWSRVADSGRPGAAARVLAAMAATAFAALVLLAVSEHLDRWALWVALSAFGASIMAANAVLMVAVVREAGLGRIGHDSGVVGFGLFLGFMTGPVAFGALVDLTDSYAIGWAMTAVLCLVTLAIALTWYRTATRAAR